MKTLYKNSTTYCKKSLSEAYETPTQIIKIIMIICGVFFIFGLIGSLAPESPEKSIDVGYVIFCLIAIIYFFSFGLNIHKFLAKRDLKRYNVLYHSNQVDHETDFTEDDIKMHNLSDGGIITLYYNQLLKIKETSHYFILYVGNKKLFVIIDKLGFSKGDSGTFKEFITSKIKSSKELKKQEKSEKTK